MQLNDKVIIITGGCQGLGRSMAEYFASKGTRLALVDLNQESSTRPLPPARPRESKPAPTCATSPMKSRWNTWSPRLPKTSAPFTA